MRRDLGRQPEVAPRSGIEQQVRNWRETGRADLSPAQIEQHEAERFLRIRNIHAQFGPALAIARERRDQDPATYTKTRGDYQAALAAEGIDTIDLDAGTNPLAAVGQAVGPTMHRAGQVTKAALGDIASLAPGGTEPGVANLRAFANEPDAPLPIEQQVADVEGRAGRFGGKVALVVAGAVPVVGAASALGAIGVPHTAANLSVMAFDPEGKLDPIGAAAALGIPFVDKAGRALAGKFITKRLNQTKVVGELLGDPAKLAGQVVKQHPALTREGVVRALEVGGGQLASQLYLNALAVPGILDSDDPAKALEDSIAGNLGLSLLGAPEVVGKGKTRTAANIEAQGGIRVNVEPARPAPRDVTPAAGSRPQLVPPAEGPVPDFSSRAGAPAGPGHAASVQSPAPRPTSPAVDGVVGVPVIQVPAGEIVTRPDLMQFKRIDDEKRGTNAEDKLTGQWDDLKAGNLLVWEPKEPAMYGLAPGERYIVANGHHRFEFGLDQAVKGFNVQVVREADGYSANDARSLGAEINIAGGRGSIYDQARFIRNEAEARGQDAALERARRVGARGRKAATIAIDAGNDLFTSFINEQLTPDQAEAIARSAPGSEPLQRIGIQEARRGMGPAALVNFIEAIKVQTAGQKAEALDLFGADDSALKQAKAMADKAAEIRRDLEKQIRATDNAAKNPEEARRRGLEFGKSPEDLLRENEALRAERERWENWAGSPDLVGRVRAEVTGPKAQPEPVLSEGPDRPAAAAVRVGEKVFTGAIHPQAWERARRATGVSRAGVAALMAGGRAEGFVTTSGRFVTRQDADREFNVATTTELGEAGVAYEAGVDGWGVPRAPITLPDNDPLLYETRFKEFMPDGVTPRKQWQDKQINAMLAMATPVPAGEQPTAYLLGGGSGAGKSTVLRQLVESGVVHPNHVLSNSDLYKGDDPELFRRLGVEAIPEFREIVKHGDGRAASVVHEESSAMERRTFTLALQQRKNIVFDGTMANRASSEPRIAAAREAGYRVVLIGVTIDPLLAVQRAAKRGQRAGRYVHTDFLLQAHKGFANNFPAYAGLVDQAYLFDNNENFNPRLIARKEDGKPLAVVGPELYSTFGRIGNLNEHAKTPQELWEGQPSQVPDEPGRAQGREGERGARSAQPAPGQQGPASQGPVSQHGLNEPGVLQAAVNAELNRLQSEGQRRPLTHVEAARIVELQRQLGQQDLEFGVTKRYSPQDLDRMEKEAEQKAEVIRRQSARKVAGQLETQRSLLPEPGQISLFDRRRHYEPVNQLLLGFDPQARARDLANRVERGARRPSQPGTLLGLAIAKDLQDTGRVSFVGQTVKGAEDLAALAQVIRDPRYETARVYFVDSKDKIVAQRVYGTKLPGTVKYPDDIHQRIHADLKASGAVGYYLLHNHPSGNPSPSEGDIRATNWIASRAPGLRSHVIIDHGTYTVLRTMGHGYVDSVTERILVQGEDKLTKPAVPNPKLGMSVLSAGDLRDVVAGIYQPGKVVIIGRATRGQVRGIYELSTEAFKRLTGKRGAVLLRRFARETGSGQLFAVGVPIENQMDARKAMVYGLFQDVIFDGGGPSMQEQGHNAGVFPGYELGAKLGFREIRDEVADYEPGTRAFPPKVDVDPGISPDVKSALGPDTRTYEKRTNEGDKEYARRLIRELGVDGAESEFRNKDNGMPGAVRTILGIELIREFAQLETAARGQGRTADVNAAVARQVELIDFVAQRSTDIAQALQAMSVWSRATPAGHVAMARRIFRKSGAEFTPAIAAEILQRSKVVRNAPEGFQQQRAMVELLNYIERAKGIKWSSLPLAIWFANILSGPTTHGVNMLSNAMNLSAQVGIELVKRPHAAADIFGALGRGAQSGALDAGEVLKSGIVTGTRLQKVEAGRPLELATQEGWGKALIPWRYVFRFMAAEDLLFFKAAEEMRSAIAARIVAKKEGLKGAALTQRVQDIIGNVPAVIAAAKFQATGEGLSGLDFQRRVREIILQRRPAEVQESAQTLALKVTFNQEPYGVLGHVARGINWITQEVPALRVIVPFTNIVANVTNESLNYVPPIGLARALHGTWSGNLDGKPAGKEEILDQYLRALAGLVALAAIAALSAWHEDEEVPAFRVHGAGPRTADQRNQLKESGWIPYSFQVNDKFISYGYTPLAVPAAILGNYMDAVRFKHLDETDLLNRSAFALFTSGRVITEQSFLSGVADLFTTLERDSTKRAGEAAVNRVARITSSFVIPNAVRQVDQVFDPTVYDATTVQSAVVNQVPFARRQGKPAINALGEPVQKYLSAKFVSEARPNELWNTLTALQAWVPVPEREIIIGDRKRGEDYFRVLTPEERYDFIQESGWAIQDRLEVELDRIRSMEPEQAREFVRTIAARERAKVKERFK